MNQRYIYHDSINNIVIKINGGEKESYEIYWKFQ